MTFNMQSVVRSKDAKRRELAALPIEEKLRMLDVLRERTLALQSASPASKRVPVARFAAAPAALESK